MASLELKLVQYWSHLDHFGPPRSSQKLSGRPPKASLDLDRRPKPSPKRTSSFSYDKTTHVEDQKRHVGTPNKPQPPPPVELFFDSAPYTSSCKRPNSPTPQGRRSSEGLRPHAPTLGKGSQPNVSFAPNSKLEPKSKPQTRGCNSKLQIQKPNSQQKT